MTDSITESLGYIPPDAVKTFNIKLENQDGQYKFLVTYNLADITETNLQLAIYKDGELYKMIATNISNFNDSKSYAPVLGIRNLGRSIAPYTWTAEFLKPGSSDSLLTSAPLRVLSVKSIPASQNLEDRFPEMALRGTTDKIRTGVCFSGGGTRAMALATGQMRALTEAGLLADIDYTTSVSGGSWAATMFSYQQGTSYFGRYNLYGRPIDPGKLSTSTTLPSMLQGGVSNAFLVHLALNAIGVAASNLKEEVAFLKLFKSLINKLGYGVSESFDTLWVDSVGGNFFSGLNLHNPKQEYRFLEQFSLNSSTISDIQKQSPILENSVFESLNQKYAGKEKMPYPIVNSAIGHPTNISGATNPGTFVGFEYTPLYSGAAHNGTVRFANNSSFDFDGSAIQNIGMGGTYLADNTSGEVWIQTNQPSMSLTVASGTSSSAYAGATSTHLVSWNNIAKILLSTFSGNIYDIMVDWFPSIKSIITKETFTQLSKPVLDLLNEFMPQFETGWSLQPQANYWTASQPSAGENFAFVDGGCIENFGIMALLRRKVEQIVVFVNTAESYDATIDYSSQIKPDDMDFSVPALFGKFSAQTMNQIQNSMGVDITHAQVFSSDDFTKVTEQLSAIKNTKGGKYGSLIANTSLEVQANEWWEIEGGWTANIIWVYNEENPNWRSQLSKDTNETLTQQDEAAELGTFPLYETVFSTVKGMTPLQLNALANVGAFSVNENLDVIKPLLTKSS